MERLSWPSVKSKSCKFIIIADAAVGVDLPALVIVLRVSFLIVSSDCLANANALKVRLGFRIAHFFVLVPVFANGSSHLN